MRAPADRATLKVVTMPNDPEHVAESCAGTYTCECRACCEERAKLVRLGVRRQRPPGRRAA